jgi:hypothetical protein
MEDTLKGQVEQKALINDEYYYKHIFKKTEKIVSAVFFIISKSQGIAQDHVVRADLERRAKDTHSIALSLLSMEPDAARYGMQTLLHALVSLDSILRIFAAMGGISRDNQEVIAIEIDGVQRSMRRYLGGFGFDLTTFETQKERPTVRPTVAPSARVTRSIVPASTALSEVPNRAADRATQVLNVLKDKEGIGIKDIHEVISDCSEKTIQRELMTLIEKGLVRREGDRRWSRYFLV